MSNFGEPWRLDGTHRNWPLELWDTNGDCVYSPDQNECGDIPRNVLERIVACVNACAGIPTDGLRLLPDDECVCGEPRAWWGGTGNWNGCNECGRKWQNGEVRFLGSND